MSAVALHGVSVCTGHDCWPSRGTTSGSPTTFVEGSPVHRQSDGWATHCCVVEPYPCHAGSLASGSSTYYAEGLQVGRIGDPVNCGSTVATGASTTFAN